MNRCVICDGLFEPEDAHHFYIQRDTRYVCGFCLATACRNYVYQRIEELRSVERFFDEWKQEYRQKEAV